MLLLEETLCLFLSFFLYLFISVCLSFLFVSHLSEGISWAVSIGNPIFSYQQWQSMGNPRGARPAGRPLGWHVSSPWPCVRSPSLTLEPWIIRLMHFYVWCKYHRGTSPQQITTPVKVTVHKCLEITKNHDAVLENPKMIFDQETDLCLLHVFRLLFWEDSYNLLWEGYINQTSRGKDIVCRSEPELSVGYCQSN